MTGIYNIEKTATLCGAAAKRNYRATLFAVLVAEQILGRLILLDAWVAAILKNYYKMLSVHHFS